MAELGGEKSTGNKSAKLETQKLATDLRLDFLKVLACLEGKEAKFHLYGKEEASSGTAENL